MGLAFKLVYLFISTFQISTGLLSPVPSNCFSRCMCLGPDFVMNIYVGQPRIGTSYNYRHVVKSVHQELSLGTAHAGAPKSRQFLTTDHSGGLSTGITPLISKFIFPLIHRSINPCIEKSPTGTISSPVSSRLPLPSMKMAIHRTQRL